MADTDTETLPNGTGGLSTEEEDERMKQRPADIDADVREMERRKRVEALMSSKLFREELERVLDQQMNEGADAPLLQRIREMVGGRLHTGSLRGPSCVLPINDIRGIEGVGYEKGEKILRCKLAAVYRLVDLFGWTQAGVGSQITARLNTAVEQVLTTPRGMLPHEVTASSLVKVDMQGTVQDQGTTNFPVNVAGFSVHASVHAARPDVRCVLHIRSPAALAVSAMKNGLLPLSTEAVILGEIAYHTVPAGVLDNEERDKIIHVLGPHSKVLFLTSNGALCCGETLEEAFYQAKNLTAACDVQLRLAALPLDSLHLIDEDARKQIYEASRKPPADGVKWRIGGEEFEALMRMLDNAGFRTGYIYRHPLVKNDVPKPRNDVEVPPAVSSLGYLLEEEEMYKQGLWKKGGGKVGERTRWLNSPNVYQKVEVLETGTTDPKKITKWVDANNEEWVQDGSPAHSSTPVKIDAALQFVPKNTNPKEFKKLQQQIKDNRRADKISAGPQSHILEGVTWDEANKLQAEDATTTHTGDHVVLMGAASKGIIQRGYQHNATVYSAPYARNPFDHVTDREIDEYKRTVERRQRGGDYDTDLSETEALSAAQVTSPLSPSETEEESRDEHRVLRIETKQAPIRSQPEVVLSDVDTTDFLHAERSHSDRTKGVKSKDPITSHKSQAKKLTQYPALCFYRQNHDYPRSTNFDQIIKKYESPERDSDSCKVQPKCKVSLNSRLQSSNDVSIPVDALEVYQQNASSGSSLNSIPSIEWDGKCRPDYLFKTRSLPRSSRRTNKSHLFRTRSHAGFINSFVRDPEPLHFHLPKCRSCGTVNSFYSWDLSRDSAERKWDCKRSDEEKIYESIGDVAQKNIEDGNADRNMVPDINIVKVKQAILPIQKVEKIVLDNDFVESQAFNEDFYLGDNANSFSSDNNQTVVEKTLTIISDKSEEEKTLKTYPVNPAKTNFEEKCCDASNVFGAEDDIICDNYVAINFKQNIEGEYLNFDDEMDFQQAVYESPVRNLIEKDIRDYLEPMDVFCGGCKNDQRSPKKSPTKKRELPKSVILEAIIEESKSSYGEDTLSANSSKIKESEHIKQTEDKDKSILKEETYKTEEENVEKDEDAISKTETKSENAEIRIETLTKKSITSEYSTASSGIEMQSFNSTIEFEKYEAVTEIISVILNRIDYEADKFDIKLSDAFEVLVQERIVKLFDNTEDIINDVNVIENLDTTSREESDESMEMTSAGYTENIFSITKLIQTIEEKVIDLNESSDKSNSDLDSKIKSEKVVEGIMNHLLERSFFLISEKIKIFEEKKAKKVITIVDYEDILFTALPLWKCAEIDIESNDNDDSFHTPRGITSSEEAYFVHSTLNLTDVAQTFPLSLSKERRVEKIDTDYTVNLPQVLIMPVLEMEYHCIEPTEYETIPNIENLPDPIKGVINKVLDDENDDSGSFYEESINESQNIESFSQLPQYEIYDVEKTDKKVIEKPDNDVEDNITNVTEITKESIKKLQNCEIARIIVDESSQTVDVAQHIIKNTKNYTDSIVGDPEDRMLETEADQLSYKSIADDDDHEEFNNSYTISQQSNECYDEEHPVAKEVMIGSTEEKGFSIDLEMESQESIKSGKSEVNNKWLDETFVSHSESKEEMNTAFVAEHVSFSSPVRDGSKVFDVCGESPIKNTCNIAEDLYEKEYRILGSPFVKQAPLISMSQSLHSGGIKYWVSFDDSLENVKQNKTGKKFKGNIMPSFFTVNFEENEKPNKNLRRSFSENSSINWELEKETEKRTSVLCAEMTDLRQKSDTDKSLYSANMNDSFVTACASKTTSYYTCESSGYPTQMGDKLSDMESIILRKKLLYDNSRVESNSSPMARQCHSWPPFDESVFYKILSKFRMSESFDPSDLENFESSQ